MFYTKCIKILLKILDFERVIFYYICHDLSLITQEHINTPFNASVDVIWANEELRYTM